MRPFVRSSRLLLALLLVFGVFASTYSAIAQEGSNGSETNQGSAARTGVQPGPGPDLSSDLVLRWQIDIDEPEDSVNTESETASNVTAIDGVAYFGAVDGTAYAVDIQTGEIAWQSEGDAPLIGAPAVADDVVIQVDILGGLHARSTTDGEPLWSVQLAEFGLPDLAPRASPSPAVVDGVAYLGWFDGNVWAIDAETGETLWTNTFEEGIVSPVAVANGQVYAVADVLRAIDAETGATNWEIEPANFTGADALLATDAGVWLHFFRGVALYSAESGDLVTELVGNDGPRITLAPAIFGDQLVFGTADDIRSVNVSDGSEFWRYEFGSTFDFRSPITIADGVVWFQYQLVLMALDLGTGELLLEFNYRDGQNEGDLRAAITVADGLVVLRTGPFRFAAFGAPTDSMLAETAEADAAVATATAAVNQTATAEAEQTAQVIESTNQTATAEADARATATREAAVVAATATVQAAQTITAEAEFNATQTAEAVIAANLTATVEAVLGATATVEAAVTATARAEIEATEEAIEAAWEAWAGSVDTSVTSADDFPASFSLEGPQVDVAEDDGQIFTVVAWTVDISSNSTGAMGIGIFESEEVAKAQYESLVDEYLRSGFAEQSLDGFGDDAACFTLFDDGLSTAACFVLRGDSVLITNAEIEAEAVDAAMLNATDLMRLLDAAVQGNPHP